MSAPIETKVTAASVASGITGLVMWLLGNYFFKGTPPDAVAGSVAVLAPLVVTFFAGYGAPHTRR